MIESEKPIKICHFCRKEVRNLGIHIINNHPNILAQLDEYTEKGSLAPSSPAPPLTPRSTQNLTAMIQEKLDIMLNIKIIEMLSKSPDATIQDISNAINPPKNTTLEELKAYHELVYGKEKSELPYIETENQWANLAQQALPIVRDMFANRQQKQPLKEVEKDVRGRKETNPGILKPIQLEIAGDTGEPARHSEEPGAPGDTEQQDNKLPDRTR